MTSPSPVNIQARLPWRIRSAEWVDPSLVVAGDDFTLTVTSSWRVISPKGILYSSTSLDAEDRVWDLVGQDVVRIDHLGSASYQDPRLVLSGEMALDLFSDTDLDPWVLRSGDDIVIVGSLDGQGWPPPAT